MVIDGPHIQDRIRFQIHCIQLSLDCVVVLEDDALRPGELLPLPVEPPPHTAAADGDRVRAPETIEVDSIEFRLCNDRLLF